MLACYFIIHNFRHYYAHGSNICGSVGNSSESVCSKCHRRDGDETVKNNSQLINMLQVDAA